MLFFFHLKKLLIFLAYILYIFIYKKYLKNNPRLKYIKYDRKNSKKNLFLFIQLTFFSFFFKLKRKKKIYKFFFFLQFYYLKLKIYKTFFFIFLKKIYLFYENFFKFKLLNFLSYYKNKLIILNFINLKLLKIRIKFCPLSINTILNDIYLFYQNQKLKRRFSLVQMVYNFYNYIKRYSYLIKGIFIKGLGRFTKRQRSSMYKQTFGKLLFRNFKSKFNLSFFNIITKYSQCTIRLYINYNLRFLKNFKMIFLL